MKAEGAAHWNQSIAKHYAADAAGVCAGGHSHRITLYFLRQGYGLPNIS